MLIIDKGIGWKPDPDGREPGDQVSADDADYVAEIEMLRAALAPFAGLPETSEAETAVPNDSPVTIRCQLGDMRRAFKALNP